MRTLKPLCLAGLALTLAACGDDATGPSDFPTIDAATLAQFCVRGTISPSQNVTGSISSSDCHNDIQDDGFFETWRVRVGSEAEVTFEVESNFDSFLELFRIGNLNDVEGSSVFLTEDDDSAGGIADLDARLTWTLQANTEYAIVVSGWDDSELGSYQLITTR